MADLSDIHSHKASDIALCIHEPMFAKNSVCENSIQDSLLCCLNRPGSLVKLLHKSILTLNHNLSLKDVAETVASLFSDSLLPLPPGHNTQYL